MNMHVLHKMIENKIRKGFGNQVRAILWNGLSFIVFTHHLVLLGEWNGVEFNLVECHEGEKV